MRWSVSLGVAGLVASGCLVQNPSSDASDDGDGPDDPPEVLQLVAFALFTSHYHDGVRTEGWDLMPTRGNNTEAPARCVALRGSAQFPGDSCAVEPPSAYEFYPGHDAPWTIGITYRIRQGDDHGLGGVAVAYDAGDHLVANWTGERHPAMSHMTE